MIQLESFYADSPSKTTEIAQAKILSSYWRPQQKDRIISTHKDSAGA